MNGTTGIVFAAAVLGAGIWALLPHASVRRRGTGAVLAAAGLGLFASKMPGVGSWAANAAFYTMAGVTVAAAVATVTLRNPIYCAIWFALTLLGTAGLLLLVGAQFLAVATIVVYAGAILVTFLFVLMLAQPEGHAPYDRVSWESQLSVGCGVALVAILSVTVGGALGGPGRISAPAVDRSHGVLAEDHVAQIGRQLFGRHLIAVEVAGTLLLAALVGAAVIVGRTKGPLAPPTEEQLQEGAATDTKEHSES
ncbi:MAG: NADH-quinone oxidoreductase subunit J family protein [Planctomycetota bacterium]